MYEHNWLQLSYKQTKDLDLTLPEAHRTQGIEFITCQFSFLHFWVSVFLAIFGVSGRFSHFGGFRGALGFLGVLTSEL